ncbi:MAG: hypothetical protein JNK29_17535 [Anaerolineales bacterium]|nr:hypothetical protein [Anaerolineales bacterium]
MAQSITLVPLLCPNCRAALPAQPDEIAWRCAECGQAWQLAEADPSSAFGLAPLEIFFDARLDPRVHGRPFWVAEGRVGLRRETYSGNQDRQAQEFWSQPRRFCVPAFTCPLETLVSLGMELLREPPDLQPGPAAPFTAVTLPRADVRDMAEFIVVGVEAGRKDQLKRLEANLQLSEPELWILR